ncbi:MAG: hypothetical protein ACC742_09850 [Thermoanaerobaculales bacterium]
MCAAESNRDQRQALDKIVDQMGEPGFVIRHRRPPAARKTGAHVDPEVLALAPPRSRYVRRWRRHARHCLECANIFRYFGLSLD